MSLAAQFHRFQMRHPLRRSVIGGHTWEYVDAGAGDRPLALLPGGFGTANTSWRYVLALQECTRVIALHYPPEPATLATLCAGLERFFDQLGLSKIDLLGGSASGLVAQVFVRRHPERVARLILAQSGAPRPWRARVSHGCAVLTEHLPLPLLYGLLRIAIHGFLPGIAPERAFWRAHFAEVLAAQSRLALVNRFSLAADFDANYRFTSDDLVDWKGRIVILESASDRMVGAGERATLRALYPAARVISLTGSHGASVEAPEAQIAVLRQLVIGSDMDL